MLSYTRYSLHNTDLKHYVVSSTTFCYICCQNELQYDELGSKCCQEKCDIYQMKSLHVSASCINHHFKYNKKIVLPDYGLQSQGYVIADDRYNPPYTSPFQSYTRMNNMVRANSLYKKAQVIQNYYPNKINTYPNFKH